MTDLLKPRDAKDVEGAAQWALAEGKTLEIVGHGSKRGLGRAAQWDLTLDLSDLSGVTLYEPEELILSARAGTPIAEIEALLAAHNQELAFEPADYGPLYGAAAGRGTIGGVLAANQSGPRRIKAGAARDHFLGFTAVSGRGETFKSGGRVVKNVTGYDLCKVLAGSYGTLGAMTDVTVKVLPRAETEQTLLVLGLDDAAAARAMSIAMGSSNDVSGAAHFPGPLAANVQAEAGGALTALRLEGVAPSVEHRRRALEALLKPFGEITVFPEVDSRALWKTVRNVMPFAGGERALWRISVAPTRGPEVTAAIGEGAEYFYDWAGGLIWLALPATGDGGAARVRAALKGGHATLIRAPAAIRASVPVFEPQDAGLAALTRRVKESFDPKGVFGAGANVCRGLMQTSFTLAQLADPDISEADKILRACVHCGFCTATCPTYVLLGDELDSPRGRIYLIKDMLENDRPASARGGEAYRSLPLVPGLHDDLSVRCALHAPRRSCPRAYRGNLPAPVAGSADPRRAGGDSALSRAISWRAHGGVAARPGGRIVVRGCGSAPQAGSGRGGTVRADPAPCRDAASRSGNPVRPFGHRDAGRVLGAGCPQGARRAAAGMRTGRARAFDQRRRDPPAHPPGHRGRAGGR